MKKLLFTLSMVPFILFSCKKEHGLSMKTSAKKYAVNIQVANFTAKHSAFALRTKGSHLASSDTLTNLSGYIDQFYYVVVDGNNNWVKTIVQDSTYCSTMGTITDSLPAGNYTIALVAGKNGLEVSNPDPVIGGFHYGYASQPWGGIFWTAYPNGYVGLPWQDTFYLSFPLTVGNQDINITQTLSRAVGKLEVTILDNIPANADSLYISINNTIAAAPMFGSGPVAHTTVFSVAIPPSAIGQPNFTVDRLVWGINWGFDITISCKDAGGNVINSTVAKAVVINANQKTILSGDLFSGPGDDGFPQTFTAVADTTWYNGGPQIGFSLKHH
jgi:hypothetical protein